MTIIGQLAKVSIQSASIVVLSRLVAPQDFGIYAMIVAITGVAEVLRDAGLSAAAVQAQKITNSQKSNLFWLNTIFGAMLTTAVLLLASKIGAFYHQEQVADAARVVAPVFLLNGIAAQFKAHIIRNMRFKLVALSDILSQAVGFALAVGLALSGSGYVALVSQPVAVAAVALVVLVAVSRWVPGLPRRRQHMRELIGYGVNYMATQVLVYATSNIGSVIIGRNFGATTLAYYNRAFQLFSMPVNQLSPPATNVALPVLSRIADQPELFRAYLVRAQIVLAYLSLSVFSVMFAASNGIVNITLGPHWAPVSPLLQAFAVAGVFQMLGMSTYWIFLSKGMTGSNLRFAVISRSLLLVLIAVASMKGPLACAVALSVGSVMAWAGGLWWIRRVDHIVVATMANKGIRAFLLFGIAAIPARICASQVTSSLAQICLSILVIATLVAILTICIPSARADWVEVVDTIQLITGRRRWVLSGMPWLRTKNSRTSEDLNTSDSSTNPRTEQRDES